jgi:hypothetical protein
MTVIRLRGSDRNESERCYGRVGDTPLSRYLSTGSCLRRRCHGFRVNFSLYFGSLASDFLTDELMIS